ncbi:type II pantothenate kinase [Paenibacillus sp. YN15]|uniref:type II pantothenate kinase n=1 Tax=Paenibacillus sp. YN15 TaxID=1742774 RepID=UPI000DCC17AC|nr:type II pantothenate kinase [Paenibacillus sp. YN15]RAV05532.1 type II pantothenate kinase [Paenibacillus sp. YN15]
MDAFTRIGIDAGGTLIKIAYIEHGKLELMKFPTKQMAHAVAWLKQHFPQAEYCVTGGKSEVLQKRLEQPVKQIVEFEATCKGVLQLLQDIEDRPSEFVLTNVGTGTSIHIVKQDEHFRIGGTGVGGGTMLGLSKLLAGTGEFGEIVQFAPEGLREKVDLKVSHIYEGAEPPIPGDLTASNFGHIPHNPEELQPSDLLASVIGLVGETVTTVSVHAAMQYGISSIVYIGSSFIGNELLKKVVEDYTILRGATPFLLNNGEYSGAIGALLSLA